MERFPAQKKATLLQALRWVAFEQPPLNYRHEDIEGYSDIFIDPFGDDIKLSSNSVTNSARRLVKSLARGELQAKGHRVKPLDGTDTLESDGKHLSLEKFDGDEMDFLDPPAVIPSAYWSISGIDWQENTLCVFMASGRCVFAFFFVELEFEDLKRVFPQEKQAHLHKNTTTELTSDVDYRSPFMLLMDRASIEFGERLMSAKKAEIEEWLSLEGPKIDPAWSKNKTRMMATFLRPPEKQKGGNKKFR